MRALLALALILIQLSFATEEYSDTPSVEEKVLYVNYDTFPSRVFKGEIFSITLKTLSTLEHFDDIKYKFEDYDGLEILSHTPDRRIEGRYFFDTFYFLCTSPDLKTPNITAFHSFNNILEQNPTTIAGDFVSVTTLNPPKNFSNIIAQNLTLEEFKTTSYSEDYNIVVFTIEGLRAHLSSFYLQDVKKQGFESIKESYDISSMIYFVIISSALDEFSFSYFNTISKSYEEIYIPIIVDSDSVSTQSDLTPIDHGHLYIKITVAAFVALVFLILYIYRRKFIYLLLVIIPAIYIAYAAIPIEHVTIKSGSDIYLLPIYNSTIFETLESDDTLEVQGRVDGYIKVKLHNNKIGWVKDEDTKKN